MRSILVPLFYLWIGVSLAVLIRRRVTGGSFRSPAAVDAAASITEVKQFAPPPPLPPDASDAAGPTWSVNSDDEAAVAVKSAPSDTGAEAAETLADAISGIALPCDLMPLTTDRFEPRAAAFFTQGYAPATVGTAVADEFERLGFELHPVDARTIDALRDPDHVQIQLTSAGLESAEAMAARFPQARPDALIIEIRLI